MTANTLMTELEALNQMLAAIGQGQITSLTGSLPKDASTALFLLEQKSREVQEEGWHWNTEHDYEIEPDAGTSGISLPDTTVRAQQYFHGYSSRYDLPEVAQHGASGLYNLTDQTYEFDDTVHLTIVHHLEWDKLPPSARKYIAASATAEFIMAVTANTQRARAYQAREFKARGNLEVEESRTSGANTNNCVPVMRIMSRRRPNTF
jgi:hypothetical protein